MSQGCVPEFKLRIKVASGAASRMSSSPNWKNPYEGLSDTR